MSGIGRKSEPLKKGDEKKGDDKSNKPGKALVKEDDDEDGDIATPKRDRSGTDDEPL